MVKLFSYGTLQLEQVQRNTFSRILTGTPDKLTGYRVKKMKLQMRLYLKAVVNVFTLR